MNKKELYEKCQKQEQEIQKLSLFQDNSEDILNDYDDDNDNLIEEVKKLNISLKEYQHEYHILEQSSINEKNKLRRENEELKLKKPSLNDAMGLTIHNERNSKKHIIKMNKLKSDRDAKKCNN